MHRHSAEVAFGPEQLRHIKDNMLNRASRNSMFLFFDSNEYEDRYGRYECLLGMGAAQVLSCKSSDELKAVRNQILQHQDWLFGHLSYDLKNLLEPRLQSRHESRHGWPLLQFFVPETVYYIPRGSTKLCVETLQEDAGTLLENILRTIPVEPPALPICSFQSRLSRERYLACVVRLREHIRQGDCYEVTFCNEAFAENIFLNPTDTFRRLNECSPAPFAACYKSNTNYLMGTSPERFLCKRGQQLFSQPIKGTARRSAHQDEDNALRENLRNSEKEQAENVMIADLVRNDLARSCVPGSIQAEELFGIYSFPNVHQMISTLSGTLRHDCPPLDSLLQAFPMGSMTGAPKHMAMQLIDRYEEARRELYAGTVGYFSPDGDFDFNVIIRSLFYQSEQRYLSCSSGGAITWGSEAESEWQEMLLKAAALQQLFR
ncbi:MAG: anthranilate synthase component I family protein [Bacteroidetes bacterium]|nr:anthranilate synthase component I family protein [Bacteroidota bacterium]